MDFFLNFFLKIFLDFFYLFFYFLIFFLILDFFGGVLWIPYKVTIRLLHLLHLYVQVLHAFQGRLYCEDIFIKLF